MAGVRTTLTGYLTYRGREGHWSFLLHRISGLGTGLFLTLHILDTSLVYFNPTLYAEAIALYRSTLFGIGEVVLVFLVMFHGVNGLRIAYFDQFAPGRWTIETQRRSARWALAASLVLWLPAAAVMLFNLLRNNFGLFGG